MGGTWGISPGPVSADSGHDDTALAAVTRQ